MLLTQEQKHQLCGLVGVGCDSELAAHLVGLTWGELQQETASDDQFARDLARNEAMVELVHVRNVQEAGRDPKNWRASVWFLEHYGRRDRKSIRLDEMESFLALLAGRINEVVTDERSREELIACLESSATKMLESSNTEESP